MSDYTPIPPNPAEKMVFKLRILVSSVLVCLLSSLVLPTGTAEAAPTSWSIGSSPNQASNENYLISVSCTSTTSCDAVGYDGPASDPWEYTLVESWNGTTWSIIPSPSPESTSPAQNVLSSVSCSSSIFCVAVGYYSEEVPLSETWNGTNWSVTAVPAPSPQSGYNLKSADLNGVSCTNSSECMATGTYTAENEDSQTYNAGFIEYWNGSSWSMSDGEGPVLSAVSCTGFSDCMAVGNLTTSQTVALSWNGTTWSTKSMPVVASSSFASLSCTSSTNCVAVGTAQSQTLVESWNGTSWSIVSSPDPDNVDVLYGVSCTSSTNCVTVGTASNQSSQTLVESWNGSLWSVTPSPSPNGNGQLVSLQGVSCTGSGSCVAVSSYYGDNGLFQTLVEIGSSQMAPTITSFSPGSGPKGTKVTIKGTNLAGATLVTFNGTRAKIKTDSATEIIATVPSAATTGKIGVTTGGGTATSTKKFKVT